MDRTLNAVENKVRERVKGWAKGGVREPTFALTELFPYQGEWTEEAYLALSTNRLIELSEGRLELLPMPSERHQRIVRFLFLMFYAFVSKEKLGEVFFAPLKIKLWDGKFREPDILFMTNENAEKRGDQFWRGADLVVEVISPDDPDRDVVTKREEYAEAGIPEYWLVDPRDASITVYVLPEGADVYEIHGRFTGDERATSRDLSGFGVTVAEVFEA